VDIYSPDLYLSGPPHEAFAVLRAEDPVHWQTIPGQEGYWAVLRHADIVAVARQPALYSAGAGGVVLEDPGNEQLESMRRMLLAMDPPVHGQFRRPVAPSFRTRVIEGMEPRVRSVCRTVLEEAAERGEVEFVHDVAAGVPSRVFGRLMGVPEEDLGRLHWLAEQITSSQDPDMEPAADSPRPAAEMAMYAIDLAAERRRRTPREDLAALLLGSEFGGSPMDDVTFASFFVQLVTAGNDTTKTILSAGLLTLLDHPNQLGALRADPSLVPAAVEEILRFDNPIHYFRRTATEDTRLAGVEIRAGQKVAMVYTSANRDGAVFGDPQSFDIRRNPNPHLAFGIGEHFCLGSHLARLEARVFFEELLGAFGRIELTGNPVRVRSNLNNAYKSVPLRLVA
jgi:cytochrome P450